jgi:hypothetical protein
MESITQFLEGPAKVWHVLLLAIVFAGMLHDMRNQLTAVGRVALKILGKLDARYADD